MATDGVLVVGAGPTGPMPACEPTLGGVRAVLLDERTDAPGITRAFAVHARTLQLLDARGLTADLPARGLPVPEVAPPGAVVSKLSELPTEFGMILMLPQSGTRRQIPVVDERGRIVAILDMGWERHLVAVNYDGVFHQSDRKRYVRDLKTLRALEDRGWIVIRVVAEDDIADVITRVAAAPWLAPRLH
ncbi:FAD-dependent monooxygenase [Mycolicibacterium smegmatis]|uniref:Oxygenase n=1 Tax=Mycolicibacterium smegmatis (strain MKD8) TaxID=1214915 RepID=A0A2U9PJH9_MYCSE|nr:FAD-dependent monooxygenase [Mycolicibacterium smegmatis]AWT51904.1 oxygenase [Mycolicibacterium smegmatis MKD8]